jgi:hypothetical protein
MILFFVNMYIIICLLMSPLLEHRLCRLHIRRTGLNPPRGPSANWWVLTNANAAAGTRDNKFLGTQQMTDQRLLNFRDRTPKRTDRWAIELLYIFVCIIICFGRRHVAVGPGCICSRHNIVEELDGRAVSALSVRSQKLSKVRRG